MPNHTITIAEIRKAMAGLRKNCQSIDDVIASIDHLNNNAAAYIQHLLDEREEFIAFTKAVSSSWIIDVGEPLGYEPLPGECMGMDPLDIAYNELPEETRKEIEA